MLRSDFDASLAHNAPPENIPAPLASLWWLKNNNWQVAHDLVDNAPGRDAAWVHALIHRMEGDAANAAYWYSRAGRPQQAGTIGQELEIMLADLLAAAASG